MEVGFKRTEVCLVFFRKLRNLVVGVFFTYYVNNGLKTIYMNAVTK